MKHHVTVGRPRKNGGYDDVQEVPSNEAFGFNRRGFVTIPESELRGKAKQGAAKTAAAGADDLSKLTVKELRAIAEPLGVTGRLKADLVAGIEAARAAE